MRNIKLCWELIYLVFFVLLVGLSAQAAVDPIPVDEIVLQEMSVVETADTILERGEAVAVFDELPDTTSATLRVGDGIRAGGRLITDPWTLRTTTIRVLSPDEYAIVPSGLASWSAGAWHLIPERTSETGDADRQGAISIVSLHPIAGIAYESDAINTELSQSPGQFGSITTNVFLEAAESEQPPTGDTLFPFRAAISNIVVAAWTAPHLIDHPLDLRHNRIQVRDPGVRSFSDPGWGALRADEPVPRSWFERVMTDRYGDDWWRYPAGGAVYLNKNPLYASAKIRREATDNTEQWIYRTPSGIDREILSAVYASGDTSFTNSSETVILAADIASDPIRIWISATVTFTSAPTIQHVGSLTSGAAWSTLTTTTAWPATTEITVAGQTRTTYLLQCANPGEGFFRASGEIDDTAIVSDYIEFGVADLRNIGTVSAGQGFRVAVPTGGTNYVAGITTNLMIGASTLQSVGGIITGVSPSAGITTIGHAAWEVDEAGEIVMNRVVQWERDGLDLSPSIELVSDEFFEVDASGYLVLKEGP